MVTPANQQKQKRSLLAAISRRSLAKECQITAGMLTREKERFIASHAVQSATLFDVRQKQSGYFEARREWKVREQKPIVPRSLHRVCLEPIIQCFIYCDNIILIAPDYARAQSAADALDRYFTVHRAGPFEVKADNRALAAHLTTGLQQATSLLAAIEQQIGGAT